MIGTVIPNPVTCTCTSTSAADSLRRYLFSRHAPVTTEGATAILPGDRPEFALHVLLTAKKRGWLTATEAAQAIQAVEARLPAPQARELHTRLLTLVGARA
jgi:hypothetical protein